jgi:hypothetical protein
MKIRYSFSSRRTRKIDNICRQRQKYPSVARKIVEISDIVLEILDARFPEETRNTELEQEILRQNKKIIYVFNKADLTTKRIEEQIKKEFYPFVLVSCTKRKGIKDLRDLIKRIANDLEKRERREIKRDRIVIGEEGKIKVGVIGYPNTGKSSLLNLLAGKSAAGVGAEAGFTKGIQKVRLSQEIVLIDSPGVIPDEQYSSANKSIISDHTMFGGKSFSQVKDPEIVVARIMEKYPKILDRHYCIDSNGDCDELIENLGRKRGFLIRGGKVNGDQVARLILRDWQEGRIKL